MLSNIAERTIDMEMRRYGWERDDPNGVPRSPGNKLFYQRSLKGRQHKITYYLSTSTLTRTGEKLFSYEERNGMVHTVDLQGRGELENYLENIKLLCPNDYVTKSQHSLDVDYAAYGSGMTAVMGS